MRTDTGASRLWDIARAFQPSRILLSSLELGIFGALGGRRATSDEVAEAIGADARATNRLMNALVVLGLITRRGSLYRNSPDAEKLLVPGKRGYLGDALLHAANMWRSWSTLTDAVKAGKAVYRRDKAAEAAWAEPFIAAMHHNASLQAPMLVKLINLNGVGRLLDVGGGSGAHAIAFCRAKLDLEAVVFDLPEVVRLTRRYVEDAGLSDRIKTRSGDYLKSSLGTKFDLVWLSQVIHSNSAADNIELFRKCWAALRPGGRLALQDMIIEPNRLRPPVAAVFALNMLVATPAGDTYTQAQVEDWFREAGFAHPTRVNAPDGNNALLSAVKPADEPSRLRRHAG